MEIVPGSQNLLYLTQHSAVPLLRFQAGYLSEALLYDKMTFLPGTAS